MINKRIEFIAAVYNEEDEIHDLIDHVYPYVDAINIVDDSSTDNTLDFLYEIAMERGNVNFKSIPHTGLPETVKSEALKMVEPGSWVILLDADERFGQGVLSQIEKFCHYNVDVDYVYCPQVEIIDGKPVREFQKCKVFRKEAVTFPLDNIHADDQFTGSGTFRSDWYVLHRKTSYKQRKREKEYLDTYKKLLDEGKIDQGRFNWLVNLHHFER